MCFVGIVCDVLGNIVVVEKGKNCVVVLFLVCIIVYVFGWYGKK